MLIAPSSADLIGFCLQECIEVLFYALENHLVQMARDLPLVDIIDDLAFNSGLSFGGICFCFLYFF